MTHPVGRYGRVVAVALAYAAAALPGLVLASTPTTANPLWLPAGVALCAALLGSGRGLLGVGLGAFGVHLWVMGFPEGTPPMRQLSWAAVLAAVAVLQAWIGASLVRRIAGFPSPLIRGEDIVRFTIAAGPLAGLISATLTATLLCLSGTRQWSWYGVAWINAWIGDSLGVLLVCAIVLPLWAEPRAVWQPRLRGVGLPVFGLFLAVLVLFATLRSIEEQRLENGLTGVCVEAARDVRSWFKNAQVGTKAWNAHVGQPVIPSFEQRRQQARAVLDYHDTLRGVGYVTLVSREERPAFEKARQSQPHGATHIHDFGSDGELTLAAERETHALIDFWYGREPLALPLGLDLAGLPNGWDTLARAIETDSDACISLAGLGLQAGPAGDLLAVRPLFHPGRPVGSPSERRQALRGYTLCVVDMAVVAGKATRFLNRQQIASAWSAAAAVPDNAEPPSGTVALRWDAAGMHLAVPIVLAGQPGNMTFLAGEDYLALHESRYVWWILLLGLTITALIAGQLLLLTGETALVASEVQRRTKELHEEVAERHRTEQSLRESEERRKLDEKLRETQKLESLGVMAGGIAHDFNNLLTGILGYAHLARTRLPGDAAVQPFLGQIEEASRRAAELCQQMLAYAGKGKFVIGPVDLSQLVQDAMRLLHLTISKKATLGLELEPGLPPIEADASQMRQVVMNLVMNASESIGESGGTITISTSVLNADRCLLDSMMLGSELSPGAYVCLEVADTGTGMDEAMLARIFEPFFTTKFAGRGLGLAAVQGIIRSHRGALAVRSAPGQGTTFRLLFPPTTFGPGRDVVAERAQVPAPLRGHGTILIAEDETMVRHVAVSMARTLGYEIIEASDGQQAVEVFARHRHKLRCVLLDLMMPRLDGLQTFAEMRRLAPEVPIIMMSGYAQVEVRARFPGEGPEAFLQKPFSRTELAARLEAVLRRSPDDEPKGKTSSEDLGETPRDRVEETGGLPESSYR